MSNLKIGDRVVRTGEHHYIADGRQNYNYDSETEVGQRGEIVDSYANTWGSESWSVRWDNGRSSAIAGVSLTLESEYDATVEPKYKVGQKVRVIADTNSSYIPLGTIVTLTKKHDNPDFKWRTDYTEEFMAGSLVTESDIAPVGDDRIEVDPEETFPQIGDVVTLRYLPTSEEFTSTLHAADYGYSVLGWSLLDDETYTDAFEDGDAVVVKVLRTVVEEPEAAQKPVEVTGDYPVGTLVKFENDTHCFRVREGYEDTAQPEADWRALYNDGSTGMWTWEEMVRFGGGHEVVSLGRGDD